MTAAPSNNLKIATRASSLALWQARHVQSLLQRANPDLQVELVHATTTGDRDRKQPLTQFGGFGVFTREVQKAVLDGRADIAVHSLKDLPTASTAGLKLAAVPTRGSMFDALALPLSQDNPQQGLDSLPQNARVGTGSLRRRSQLLYQRPDLQMLQVRGNVETRLRKMDEGEYDALVLAETGLQRLELQDRISATLKPPLVFPAVGQGALGIECREDDQETLSQLEKINDPPTWKAISAERSLLAHLRAGCHAPVGVLTQGNNDRLSLEAVVLSPDGQERLSASASAPTDEGENLGRQVAQELIEQGADKLIDSARQNN